MVIAIGCDHTGFPFRSAVSQMLEGEGHQRLEWVIDNIDSMDSLDFIGSNNGVYRTSNKHRGLRAVVCCPKELVENTDFQRGRHGRRVGKISKLC